MDVQEHFKNGIRNEDILKKVEVEDKREQVVLVWACETQMMHWSINKGSGELRVLRL